MTKLLAWTIHEMPARPDLRGPTCLGSTDRARPSGIQTVFTTDTSNPGRIRIGKKGTEGLSDFINSQALP
jgi:hypothetical protein